MLGVCIGLRVLELENADVTQQPVPLFGEELEAFTAVCGSLETVITAWNTRWDRMGAVWTEIPYSASRVVDPFAPR